MSLPHAVLIDRLSQWIFARPDLDTARGHYYQVVISASRDDQRLIAERERFADALSVHLSAVRPGAASRRDVVVDIAWLVGLALLLMGEHFYFGHRAPEIRARIRDLRYEVLPDTRFCACWERASEIAEKALAFAA